MPNHQIASYCMLAAHSEMLLGSKDDRRRGSGSSKKEERYGHQWGGQYDEYGYGGWDYGYGDMNNGMARRPDGREPSVKIK